MSTYWDRLDEKLLVGEQKGSYVRKNVVLEKSFDFALSILTFCKKLKNKKEYEIASQLLRSGTSIGANVDESRSAESKRDFTHKIAVAAKEARETHFWLRLIERSETIEIEMNNLKDECEELVKLTTAIVKTLQSK